MPETSSQPSPVFALPARLAHKSAAELIAADERHFTTLSNALQQTIAELSARLDAERISPGGKGQAALERDLEIHRITSRLRALTRYGPDLTLGRMIAADGTAVYVGRFGLLDAAGDPLLVDWRSPAAEPFFAATAANPLGLVSRRRYRWTSGRITDYWDEAFADDALGVALDDDSAFIASLGSNRSPRMRDVLATIQSDQDAIIRASSRGPLIVDGGPGTGKTVVALHRAAYLLYSDPRLAGGNGGVLFVGPHTPYLAYVADVLPSLGEEGVQTCTLRNLVPQGATAGTEPDAEVARIKATADVLDIVDRAVRHYERAPSTELVVETPWAELELGADEWEEAFGAAEAGIPHNEARELVWRQLLDILADRLGDEVAPHLVERALAADDELRAAFANAWPLLDPAGVVADLFSVPAYLRQSASGLSDTEVLALQREHPREWTTSDLPFLDAARQRIGDPDAARIQRRRESAFASELERIDRVVDDLLAADDGEGLAQMFRQWDMREALVDETVLPSIHPDRLAGPFAHIVVDEAQELTDAEWMMLLTRCPSRSLTIVGDRAQARHGFTESWTERFARIGLSDPTLSTLTVNYRTPEEVMAVAEPVIRAAIPDANVPTSIRSSGVPVRYAQRAERERVLDVWLAENPDGIAAVVTIDAAVTGRERVSIHTPVTAKGLEFDLVVLDAPDSFGGGIEGAVDRYVSMTRATRELVVLS